MLIHGDKTDPSIKRWRPNNTHARFRQWGNDKSGLEGKWGSICKLRESFFSFSLFRWAKYTDGGIKGHLGKFSRLVPNGTLLGSAKGAAQLPPPLTKLQSFFSPTRKHFPPSNVHTRKRTSPSTIREPKKIFSIIDPLHPSRPFPPPPPKWGAN